MTFHCCSYSACGKGFLKGPDKNSFRDDKSEIVHRWACHKVYASLNCFVSYQLHTHNFLITYVALHATAEGHMSPMQGSTWMSDDNEINMNDLVSQGNFMALLTTPPPEPTHQSQIGQQDHNTQYYRPQHNRYMWTPPPPWGPPRAPRCR
jgi:hypothetical protein